MGKYIIWSHYQIKLPCCGHIEVYRMLEWQTLTQIRYYKVCFYSFLQPMLRYPSATASALPDLFGVASSMPASTFQDFNSQMRLPFGNTLPP